MGHTVAPDEILASRSIDRRGYEPGVWRPQPRQSGQVGGPNRRLKLVESTDQYNDPSFCARAPKQLLERAFDFLVACVVSERFLHSNHRREFIDPHSQHGIDLTRPGADAGCVGKQNHILLPQAAAQLREQRTLAGAGRRRYTETPTRIALG